MPEPGQKDIKAALEIDCYCGCDDPMSSEPKCDTLQDAVCRPHRQMAQALAAAREEGFKAGQCAVSESCCCGVCGPARQAGGNGAAMTPESLVPTRETCERLKAAGFPQTTDYDDMKTYFAWYTKEDGTFELWSTGSEDGMDCYLCSAPTLAEILEVLPDSHLFPRNGRKMRVAGYLYVSKVKFIDHPPYRVDYIDNAGLLLDGVAHANPAEAAALLWLRVKEGE